MDADLLVRRCSTALYTCAGAAPRRGAGAARRGPIDRASIAAHRAAGSSGPVRPTSRDRHVRLIDAGRHVIDGRGATLVPGFVDPHTHLVFAGDRRDELQRRLAGATYAEIAADGGGIVKTVAATRAASEDDLVAAALPRLAAMLALRHDDRGDQERLRAGHGERAAHAAGDPAIGVEQPIELTATFMGAHEVPIEHRGNREAFVREVIDDMIPAVAAENLAEWCDVFCEHGVFTPDESQRILEAGRRHGLKPRIHADELALSGGSAVAARVGARSADHLIFVDADSARGMAESGVVATLLPAAAFFLKLGRFAPARLLIDHDVAGGAGNGPQSWRRVLAVDAVRDDARLLRHGLDARRGAGRRRRSMPRRRSTAPIASAASSLASRWTPWSSTARLPISSASARRSSAR